MSETAAHLIDDVIPEVGLRQWVLTFPFGWRARLAHDGGLLSALTRLFVDTVSAATTARIGEGAKTGAVTVVQRTSSDLRLNPHLHVVFLDGAYRERDGELVWRELPRLTTTDVASVLEAALRRSDRHLRPRRPDEKPKRRGARRLWAELLARTFAIDVLQCPKCSGRMKLVAMVTDPRSVRAYLRGIDEPYEVPERSPSRGPPYWRSTVLRKKALDRADDTWA